MNKVYVHPVFSDMTIFTDDPHLKSILYQLASGSNPHDFKYDPETQTLHYKNLSVKLDSNRVTSYQKFKSLISPQTKQPPQPQEDGWKKINQDTRNQLLYDYVKKLAPNLSEQRQKLLTTKLILWSEIAAFVPDDIVWESPGSTKIKEISRVTFNGNDFKITHRTSNKTQKSSRVQSPFRTHIEKYINSI